jgi:nitroreductase
MPGPVLICGQTANSEATMDCCRAGQTLMLAAHARGLGSCWVGAPLRWLRSPGIAQELVLPAGFDVRVVMILGYANETPVGNPRPRPPVHWCHA